MAGLNWQTSAEGGWMYSDNLSDKLRQTLQASTKCRQFMTPGGDDTDVDKMHHGATYYWNVYEDLERKSAKLTESTPISTTGLKMRQRSLTVNEYGLSVPWTGKLEALAKHDPQQIINVKLGNSARYAFDGESYRTLKTTPKRVGPLAGNNTSSIVVNVNGTAPTTNNVALRKGHVKNIITYMKENNIPPAVNDDYLALARPATYSTFEDDMESVHQYTSEGYGKIINGEKGRVYGCRFIEQTNVPAGGANDSTTFDPELNVGDAWNNGLSDWCFFMGNDVGMECMVIPEEIRAQMGQDFGRSRAVAWYAMTGFGATHPDDQSRVLMWDSLA